MSDCFVFIMIKPQIWSAKYVCFEVKLVWEQNIRKNQRPYSLLLCLGKKSSELNFVGSFEYADFNI